MSSLKRNAAEDAWIAYIAGILVRASMVHSTKVIFMVTLNSMNIVNTLVLVLLV